MSHIKGAAQNRDASSQANQGWNPRRISDDMGQAITKTDAPHKIAVTRIGVQPEM